MDQYTLATKPGAGPVSQAGKPASRRTRRSVMWFAGICILAILLVTCTGSAHSPQDLQLTYHEVTGNLSLSITHGVDDPATHYVKEVEIKRNGAVVVTGFYSTQPSATLPFTYNYTVAVSPGDVLEATAVCNIAGSASARLVIPGTIQTGAGSAITPPGTTPRDLSVYSLLWPFHALFMITGFLLLLSAVIIVQAGRKTGNWYRKHRVIAGIGVSLVVIAYIIAFSMLALSGSGHLRFPHSYVGISIILLAVVTLALGIYRDRTKTHKVRVRTVHLWLGRLLLIVMAINIVLGLLLTGIL